MKFRIFIQTKILLGFISTIFFFGAIFIISFNSINRSKIISQETASHSNQLKYINKLLRSLDLFENNVDSFFVTPYSQYLSDAKKNLSEIQDSINSFKKLSTKEDSPAINSINLTTQNLQDSMPRIFSTLIAEANSQVKKSSIASVEIRKIYSQIAYMREEGDRLFLQDTEEMNLAALEQNALLTRLMVEISILWGVSLIIGVTSSVYISRRISKPIIRLKQFSQDVAGGKLNIVADINTNDEIGDLATSFNQMTKELGIQQEKLQTYSRTLEEKIVERTKELSSKNNDLERLNKLMINRELKMIELKQEIENLKKSK